MTTADPRLTLLLRFGVALCFIGHGAFGLLRKAEWLPYFQVFGIGPDTALFLMPVIGAVDIAIGVLALTRPAPVVLAYAAAWCLWTAALRPMAGEPVWETVERAGNYGVPLALLVLAGATALWRRPRRWLAPLAGGSGRALDARRAFRVLQATTVALLAGHGMLALSAKPLLVGHAAVLGLGAGAVAAAGALELTLAAAIAIRPAAGLFLLAASWKLATEALFPLAGAPIWEVIERGGSYVAPAAAAVLVSAGAVAPRAARARPRLALPMIALALAVTAVASPAAAQERLPGMSPALLEDLRDGGLVLACRHAATDYSRQDARRVDFDDPTTQRVLSPAGERQAEELGRQLRRLRVPVGEVLASPYQRTFRSAELMFGRATVESALFGSRSRDRTLLLLTSAPDPGTNRVLVTHQGLLYRMLSRPRGSIGESDCLVLRPRDRPDILAQVTPEDWAAVK